MRPLGELPSEVARSLAGVVFDLDDTLLDGGALSEVAYGSLFRLREAGLTLIACTGRPAGWVDVIMRQWPIDAGIAENGAIAFERDGARVARIDRLSTTERGARREELLAIAATLVREHPSLALADDNAARSSDVTLDIGERVSLPHGEVRAITARAAELGVRTFVSSIHLHLTFDTDDKASAAIARCVHRGFDATGARDRFAFVGDSANDAPAFAAFRATFGVANVRHHAHRLSVPPRFVASRERGAGFAEIAERLVQLR